MGKISQIIDEGAYNKKCFEKRRGGNYVWNHLFYCYGCYRNPIRDCQCRGGAGVLDLVPIVADDGTSAGNRQRNQCLVNNRERL